MKQMRKSMALNPNQNSAARQSVANTIARASMKFELKDGTEAGELVIENDRLKTTIMVLNQKLKVQDHTEGTNERLQTEVRDHEIEIEHLRNTVGNLESDNAKLSKKLDLLTSRSDQSMTQVIYENERKWNIMVTEHNTTITSMTEEYTIKITNLESQI